MRKIEQQMINAIANKQDWLQDNTCVVFSDHIGNPYLRATIYLHNNLIAEVLPDGVINVDTDTLKDYPTRTTMSRSRALGVDVCTKRGIVMLDGKAI